MAERGGRRASRDVVPDRLRPWLVLGRLLPRTGGVLRERQNTLGVT